MIYLDCYSSPLGEIVLTSDGYSLTGLYFSDRYILDDKGDLEEKRLPIFDETKKWLDSYFSFKVNESIPSLALEGTEFQKDVWSILLTIPYGETMTYGEIAMKVAKKRGKERMSSQAVGQAVGKNPIVILVPCHRVIGTNGKLVGYHGGLDRKIKLLEIEKAVMEKRKANIE